MRDLGSRNGTKVNGLKVTDSTLKEGDVVKVGSHEFVVEAESTLKERQVDARAALHREEPRVDGRHEGAHRHAPPKGGTDETVELIDGRGKSSGALTGDTDGSKAVKTAAAGGEQVARDGHSLRAQGDAVHIRMRVDGQMVGSPSSRTRSGSWSGGWSRRRARCA